MLYRWHPWYGREVSVRGYTRTPDHPTVQLIDEPETLRRQIPAWMLDQRTCESMVIRLEPQVGLAQYGELRQLLDDTVHSQEDDDATSTTPPERGPQINSDYWIRTVRARGRRCPRRYETRWSCCWPGS